MGMSIDESMKVLQEVPKVMSITKESINVALDTMRKYQKIEQIVNHWACCGNPTDSMIAISEVLEDGNDNN